MKSLDHRRCFADAVSLVVQPPRYAAAARARLRGDRAAGRPRAGPGRFARAAVPDVRQPAARQGGGRVRPDRGRAVGAQPEIPLLVVEGRAKADGLAGLGLDLSELRNLHRLPNLSSPRAIYKLSRAVLTPSLVRESFGRVAAEALCNGLPVLVKRIRGQSG